MNKNILNAIAVSTLAMGLASCGENSWNDHYLDGFKGGIDYESSETATYTLTADDYATISSLIKANAVGDEEIAAAKAIDTNKYFDKNSIYPASVAIPAFLDNAAFPYYLAGNGSTVDVIFREASSVPAELTALAGAKTYTVTTEDYQKVWGSETAFIKSFAPEATAASKLASLIPTTLGDEDVADGTYAVVTYNTSSQNPMFGFPAETPNVAELYADAEFKAGKYVLYADGIAANIIPPTTADGKYAYFYTTDVTVSGNQLSGFDFENNVFVFTATSTPGQYYMGDDFGHYYYGDAKYNNFYINSTPLDEDKYKWTVTKNDDGTWTIKNVLAEKWVQYSASYKSWGDYNYDNGLMPVLYVPSDEPAEPVEVPLYTPASVTENAVYCYSGGKWVVAEGVTVLNPADYTAMGSTNNKLSDAELYLPTFLKGKLPYAQAGDQEYVVYNGTTANLYVYDGSAWTLNENGLETVTGRFEKANGVWSFVKYIGKAIFNEFNEQQIELDRSYLFVSGNICGVVIDKNSPYGYILTTSISVSGGQYVAPSDANAYLFASSCEIDGKIVTAPEGKFLIRDSYGRYLYLQGTFSSANLAKTPALDENGEIAVGYLWNATNNGDGTWTIANEFNGRRWYYSSKHNNFAAYATQSDVDVFPSLYILAE